MQFATLVSISLLTALGLAQTTTFNAANLPSSTACAAQPVFDSCLAIGNGYASSCAAADYGCLCQKWGDILTCYLQCPNDAGYAGALATKTTYCNNAAIYTSSTTSAASKAISSAVSSAVQAATSATTSGASGGAVRASSTSAPASTSTSGAERMIVGAGVGLMGLVAAVL